MVDHISIDVTDAKQSAVPKESSESTSTTSELRLKIWYMILYPTAIFRSCDRKMRSSERKP